jgi:hypothetical protein
MSFYPTNNEVLLKRFPLVFNFVIGSLFENEDVVELINMTLDSPSESNSKKDLIKLDKILAIETLPYLQGKIKEFYDKFGNEMLQKLMNTVDPKVLEQYQKFK